MLPAKNKGKNNKNNKINPWLGPDLIKKKKFTAPQNAELWSTAWGSMSQYAYCLQVLSLFCLAH